MRYLAVIFALIFCLPAAAQEEEGKGYLIGLIEDNLSDIGREVRITGFQGAFSAKASLETLTIADQDGVWLTIADATLDWNRAALLKGRLEINALRAARLELSRLPRSDEARARPQAAAPGFSLPDLPVSIEIDALEVDRIFLGAPVLGEAAQMSLSARAELIAGSGAVSLSANRIDGAEGRFAVEASYQKEAGTIAIDLNLKEAADGIAARILDLPGRPSVELSVAGAGPLDAFETDILLATDGTPRLTGEVRINSDAGPDPARNFDATLSGDVTSLFAPQYRPFFGPDIALKVSGRRAGDGALDLSAFDLATQSMSLKGAVRLNQESWPEFLDITGQITPPDGSTQVQLPLSGPPTMLRRAAFDLDFDSASGNQWRSNLDLNGLRSDGYEIDQVTIDAAGLIEGTLNALGRVSAAVALDFDGLALPDPALQAATGSALSGQIDLVFDEGQPLEFERILLLGDDFSLRGRARTDALRTGLATTFDLSLDARNLARFAKLVSLDLTGAATLALAGEADLGGAFDVTLDGTAQDLRFGIGDLDKLLSARTALNLSAKRDETGLELRQLEISGGYLGLDATGRLAAQNSTADFNAKLNDISRIIPDLSGPVSVSGRATQQAQDWQITAQSRGPASATADLSGRVASDGTLDLAARGEIPLGLSAVFLAPRSLNGTARFDLAIQGAAGLDAISGTISTSAARFSAPNLRFALEDIGGTVTLRRGSADLNFSARPDRGGQITISGPVNLSPPMRANLALDLRDVIVSDPQLYKSILNGALRVSGPLTQGATITGDILIGQTEIIVPASGVLGQSAIPQIRHIGGTPAISATRAKAGLTKDASNNGSTGAELTFPLDITVRAPSQIFVRGRGLDAELGGALRLEGTTSAPISSGALDLLRGRLDILGKRFTLDRGRVQLQGDFDPYLDFEVRSTTPMGSASILLEGQASSPNVRFSSVPDAPEDEVLAQLFFGRDIGQISAFQALQLTNAVASLSGRGGSGVITKLREGFDLDDLDIATDSDGDTAVTAGKYLSENVYTDVTISGQGKNAISLNLDVSPNVTAKGRLREDGRSSLGLFFEKDY